MARQSLRQALVRARAAPIALALLLAPSGTAAELPTTEPRIVAIGDVHGELTGFRTILRAAGLIDDHDTWTGGSANLVQTGDLVERGTRVREVLDLMMSLEEQAEAAGGRVHALLGNHEVNNLLGYLDYESTPPEIYAQIFAGFVDERSSERRQRALKQWSKWRRRFPQCGSKSKADWEAEHPPGFVEYFAAIGPQGAYGQWLRGLPTFTAIGTTLFGHAGPSPWLATQEIDSVYALNRSVSSEIEAFDRVRDELIERGIVLPFFTLSEIYCALTEELVRTPSKYHPPLSEQDRARLIELRNSLPTAEASLTLHPEGPLWYRGYAHLQGHVGRSTMAELLEKWRVTAIVVAHTPQKGRIAHRFGSAFLIDTGMAYGPAAGGVPAALEIADGGFSALYAESTHLLAERLPEAKTGVAPAAPSLAEERRWLGPAGTPLPFRTEAEVVEFLRTARVIGSERIPSGENDPRKLLLEQYGIRAHAILRTFDIQERNKRLPSGETVRFFTDSFRNEVAAYQLAQLLGIDKVFPAVRRTIDGSPGSVQLWVEDAISESERIARDIHPPDLEQWERQADDMRIFDNLINNFDRAQGDILVDPDWRIWLVDHTQSFGAESRLPDPEDIERCSRRLWERIASLDADLVRQRLAPHLDRLEINALFERRTRLLELIRTRIAEIGEAEVLFDEEPARAAETDAANIEAASSY